ncbi:unnamed protein product [Ilex paraguariensis]|uniref:Transmembrane protein n=1 Tax=Ilex paraguariensis TaxID=185542 RepID=A0ABC8TGW5_9AQUA
MSRGLRSFSSCLLALLLGSYFFLAIEARPFNILKSHSSAAAGNIERFFDGLSLGAIKQGPSPGAGHKVTDHRTLGKIMDSGPSPGGGHK